MLYLAWSEVESAKQIGVRFFASQCLGDTDHGDRLGDRCRDAAKTFLHLTVRLTQPTSHRAPDPPQQRAGGQHDQEQRQVVPRHHRSRADHLSSLDQTDEQHILDSRPYRIAVAGDAADHPTRLGLAIEAHRHSLQMRIDARSQVVDDRFAQFECQSLSVHECPLRPCGESQHAQGRDDNGANRIASCVIGPLITAPIDQAKAGNCTARSSTNATRQLRLRAYGFIKSHNRTTNASDSGRRPGSSSGSRETRTIGSTWPLVEVAVIAVVPSMRLGLQVAGVGGRIVTGIDFNPLTLGNQTIRTFLGHQLFVRSLLGRFAPGSAPRPGRRRATCSTDGRRSTWYGPALPRVNAFKISCSVSGSTAETGSSNNRIVGIGQQCTSKCQSLALSSRKRHAVFAEQGIVAVGKVFDELVGSRQSCRHADLLSCRVGTAKRDVRTNRVAQQQRFLQHQSNATAQHAKVPSPYIDTVDLDSSHAVDHRTEGSGSRALFCPAQPLQEWRSVHRASRAG